MFVALAGEVDMANSPQLGAWLSDRAQKKHLVVDCTDLAFIDSSGLKALLEAKAAFQGQVALCAGGSQLERLLEITGLEELLLTFDTLDEARSYFHRI